MRKFFAVFALFTMMGCAMTQGFEELRDRVDTLEQRAHGMEYLISSLDFVSQTHDCLLLGEICLTKKTSRAQCQQVVEECVMSAYMQFMMIQKAKGCKVDDKE